MGRYLHTRHYYTNGFDIICRMRPWPVTPLQKQVQSYPGTVVLSGVTIVHPSISYYSASSFGYSPFEFQSHHAKYHNISY